jgi:hypothetical protein
VFIAHEKMNKEPYLSIPRLTLALIILMVASLPVFAQSIENPSSAATPAASAPAESPSTPNANRGSGIEFVPFRGLLVAAERGATRSASIEIINRDAQPLEIAGIENASERFTAQIETIEPGQRYRLSVTFEATGPDGKVAELLYLVTDRDRISIPVHTAVIPRVYTFPRVVDMGKFPVSDIRLNPQTARTAAQILMVYRKNTTGFEIKVTSDLPFLKIESEQGPAGDRWENTIWLDSERVQPGEFEGTIFIETNDPEMPKLEVPVTGILLKQ